MLRRYSPNSSSLGRGPDEEVLPGPMPALAEAIVEQEQDLTTASRSATLREYSSQYASTELQHHARHETDEKEEEL